MKEYLKDGLVLLVAAALGGLVVVGVTRPADLAGDFPGGITPTQLFTANSSAGSVSPISGLPNVLVPGAISAGGTVAANQVTVVYTATTSYPTANVNLGPIQATTSTTSTTLAFNASGFSVGDACEVTYNGATTTGAFGADAFITSVSTSTNAATATITFWNGASSLITFTPTSSATGVSSTLKTTCFHTGV